MVSRTARYVLKGDPVTLIKLKTDDTFKGWDNQWHSRTTGAITIESQHGDNPPFMGPLAIEVTFFFKRPMQAKDGWRTWHHTDPTLIHLLSFLQDVCRGTLYKENGYISAISMKKMYDEEPHTEIIIHELRKDDANKISTKVKKP